MDVDIGKISRDRARRSAKSARTTGRTATRTSGRREPSFNLKLLETQRENLREELELLLGSIDAQAAEIEKTLTFETLRVYRELVQRLTLKMKIASSCINMQTI